MNRKQKIILAIFITINFLCVLGNSNVESQEGATQEESIKIPITPWEVIKRIPDTPETMEWSKRKHLLVSGPEFFGVHYIYIDKNLKYVVILLKSDFTTHVFIGNLICAKEWRRYDEKQNILLSQIYPSDAFEWKIYKDIVLYKGKLLPPKDIPEEPYFGKVIKVEDFNDDINDEWIVSQIKELYKK